MSCTVDNCEHPFTVHGQMNPIAYSVRPPCEPSDILKSHLFNAQFLVTATTCERVTSPPFPFHTKFIGFFIPLRWSNTTLFDKSCNCKIHQLRESPPGL
ncbi:hypothetical protein CEXT_140971 [Caerostris extrusa]|uniref:Uncharacterized protein n=1 Tax=Caerostris extrusa TaxID=172846 RepID=A0AAV4QM09_CAEEX|nr:hypothetical protein CEXT_140971 [Caerostris extrusa]